MTQSLSAGAAYFAIVFAIAFALGALRVAFLIPAVGELWATAIELPLVLIVSWIACGRIVRHVGASSLGQAAVMGGSAFALLMAVEAAMSTLAFGRSLAEHLTAYGTAAGALGLAGQAAFGLIPAIQCLWRAKGRNDEG